MNDRKEKSMFETGMKISNSSVLNWVDQKIKQLSPEQVVWIDGSEQQLAALREKACSTGELIRLNPAAYPDSYLCRTNPSDVARVEERTFICSQHEADAGPTNHWMAPSKAYSLLSGLIQDSYRGRVMYVIPFIMGPAGSPFSKVGVELTDSLYVVLSMAVMTRAGRQAADMLDEMDLSGNGEDWVRCLHCKGTLDPQQRYICHFPEDNTIISVNSAYGGNALLGKKCFALRIASHMAKEQGWLAEHMLILGLENPLGKTTYVAAAFPSACGKTNFAMMVPPEGYQIKGYRIHCVGDDIAWLRIGTDGRLWAINPENGFFGVAPGTNEVSNPNALASVKRGTIFTNTAYQPECGTVWWEGLTKTPPDNLVDWQGRPWDSSLTSKAAHPNSRFTAPAENCPCLSREFQSKNGVPISAILFGGRRSKLAPLVYQAKSWEHGVFIGSTMASETTAAASGAVGVVRRDPMAMLPFCGYHMGDYFKHWLDIGTALGKNAPDIFHVNWFRTDDNGRFLWPGFGENIRVLEWVIGRIEGRSHGVETPIGCVPRPSDLNLEGLSLSPNTLEQLLRVDPLLWIEETEEILSFYRIFGQQLPKELTAQLEELRFRLQNSLAEDRQTA